MSGISFKSIALGLSGLLLIFEISGCEKNKSSPNAESEHSGKLSKRLQLDGTISKPDDLNSLRARIDKLKASNFNELWDSIEKLPVSNNEKKFLFDSLLCRMCSIGEMDEALAKVMATFEPGKKRESFIKSVFGASSTSITGLLDFRDKLQLEGDRNAADRGIHQAIGNLENLSGLDPSAFESRGKSGREILLSGLDSYMRIVEYKQGDISKAASDVLAFAENMDSRGSLKPPLSNELITSVSQTAPFEVWKILHLEGSLPNYSILSEVAENMEKKNTAKALEVVFETGTSVGVKSLFAKWLQYDSREATVWYDGHQGRFTPDFNNQVTAALAENAARTGQLQQAKQWVGNIKDPDLRKTTEGQVWAAERDSLRKDIGKDPAGMMQSIVTGQSKYADYWIEEAMDTWVTKDFDKAQAWYQQNWNTMPANKSQYLAAAFANQATQQGDMATARQWADLIQDAKTRDRINAGIAKAEAQPKP